MEGESSPSVPGPGQPHRMAAPPPEVLEGVPEMNRHQLKKAVRRVLSSLTGEMGMTNTLPRRKATVRVTVPCERFSPPQRTASRALDGR